MSHWQSMKNNLILFFDTETTGVKQNSDRIVQIAWILADHDGNIEEKSEHIIKPEGYSIPQQATNIHGISTAFAIDKGRYVKDVLEEFSDAVDQANIIVAHNLAFDFNIVRTAYKYAEMEFPLDGKIQIDTMRASTQWCRLPKTNGRSGFKYPSLQELHYRLFGKSFDAAHSALADTKACMRCYYELAELEVITPPKPIDKLTENTRTYQVPSGSNYTDGYNVGYSAGLREGKVNGYKSGYKNGLEIGNEQGYQSGYDDGLIQGRDEGAEELANNIDIEYCLDFFVKSERLEDRIFAAKHPKCDSLSLSILAEDRNPYIRYEALKRIKSSDLYEIEKLFHELSDDDLELVAEDITTPSDYLNIILFQTNFNNNQRIRDAICKHRNFNISQYKELLKENSREIYEEYREAVAKDSMSDLEILCSLTLDNFNVVENIINNPNINDDLLKKIAKNFYSKFRGINMCDKVSIESKHGEGTYRGISNIHSFFTSNNKVSSDVEMMVNYWINGYGVSKDAVRSVDIHNYDVKTKTNINEVAMPKDDNVNIAVRLKELADLGVKLTPSEEAIMNDYFGGNH